MVFIATTHEYEVGLDKKLTRERHIAFTKTSITSIGRENEDTVLTTVNLN